MKLRLFLLLEPSYEYVIVQQKIHQQISFVSLEYWKEEDIVKLVEMILEEFKLNLNPDFKKELITSAKGPPRFIKKFFRSIYTLNKVDDKTTRII